MVSELAPACCKSSQQKGLEGDQALVHRACLEDRGIRHAEIELALITPGDRVGIAWQALKVHRFAARGTPVE